MSQSITVIHVWDVEPPSEAAAVQSLLALYERVKDAQGFVNVRVLQSHDHNSIAVILEMASTEDRSRFLEIAEVRDTLEHLHGAINVVERRYDEVRAIEP